MKRMSKVCDKWAELLNMPDNFKDPIEESTKSTTTLPHRESNEHYEKEEITSLHIEQNDTDLTFISSKNNKKRKRDKTKKTTSLPSSQEEGEYNNNGDITGDEEEKKAKKRKDLDIFNGLNKPMRKSDPIVQEDKTKQKVQTEDLSLHNEVRKNIQDSISLANAPLLTNNTTIAAPSSPQTLLVPMTQETLSLRELMEENEKIISVFMKIEFLNNIIKNIIEEMKNRNILKLMLFYKKTGFTAHFKHSIDHCDNNEPLDAFKNYFSRHSHMMCAPIEHMQESFVLILKNYIEKGILLELNLIFDVSFTIEDTILLSIMLNFI